MKKIIYVLITIVTFSGLFFLYARHVVLKSFYEGETRPRLDYNIAKDMEEKVSVALEKYRLANGTYPLSDGDKYYLKYLYQYTSIPQTYLYQDIFENGKFIKSRSCDIDDIKDTSSLYIGCGYAKHRIEYRCLDGKMYSLQQVIEK
jgi:hypothetical protein